jgi:AmmeMemoRadiSam system protein B
MANVLPRLRMNLDFMPSPVPDRPGLLIRDPYQYSDATLIVPPALVPCLQLLDGATSELELRELLVRMTGDLQVGPLQDHLMQTLDGAGFLETEAYAELVERRRREFADAPVREPSHCGPGGYPEEIDPLRATIGRWMAGEPNVDGRDSLVGIASPHVSPEGGWQSYRAAYTALRPEYADRTFVILGTSHYGAPEKFGLTRKPFVTPFGTTGTDLKLVDELASKADAAVTMEDYCHAIEHSIEFQVVFLQNVYGPQVRIVPILCGSFAQSIYEGGKPEDNEGVRRFLGTLGEIAAREGDRLLWVLGIDMAHIGRRYGNDYPALAYQGEMARVTERDKDRIDQVNSGNTQGFWELVQNNHDDLNWCGSSPLYTFLSAVPGLRGELRRYEQWNIDDQSVVSFAGMTFHT